MPSSTLTTTDGPLRARAFLRAAMQFDLVCEGEAQTPPAPEKRPDKFREAVDLERYERCRVGCTAPKRIAELTPEHIILARSSNILTR